MPVRLLPYGVLFLLTLSLRSPASAQWVNANGYEPLAQATVKCFAFQETTLFAGTWGAGIFRSADGGNSWKAVNVGLTNANVFAVAATGTSLLTGTLGGGIFRSTDAGDGWTVVNAGLSNLYVFALHVNGTTILAGTSGGIFRSSDDGENWTTASTGLTNTNVHALLQKGGNLYAGTRGGGVFLSTDNGDNWMVSSAGLQNLSIEALYLNGTSIFAGTWGGGVFRSTDDGVTWAQANTGLATLKIWTFQMKDSAIFTGTDVGVFRSSDDGENWIGINNGIPLVQYPGFTAPAQIMALAVEGTNLLAGTQDFGIYSSVDSGAIWRRFVPYLADMSINAIATTGNVVFAAVSFYPWSYGLQSSSDDGIYRSSDGGANWKRVLVNPDGSPFASVAASGVIVFAGTMHGVFRSSDLGNHWTDLIDLSVNENINSILILDATIVAGSWEGIFRSTDGGDRWETALPVISADAPLAMCDSTIFAAGDSSYYAGIYRSTNRGKDWKPVLSDTSQYTYFTSITVCGQCVLAGTPSVGSPSTLYRSMDNGDSWTSVEVPLPMASCWAVHGTTLFAGTSGSGVHRTTDFGQTWTTVGMGAILSFGMGDSVLYEGTYEGLFRRPLAELLTSALITVNPLPSGYSLEQNYPNPFNPETRITFSLPEESQITIQVYDLLGRGVASLLHEKRPPGQYLITWNAGTLPSGVYFYRMEATSTGDAPRTFTQVRKTLLLK